MSLYCFIVAQYFNFTFIEILFIHIFICVPRHATGDQRTVLQGGFSLVTLQDLNLGRQACAQVSILWAILLAFASLSAPQMSYNYW